MKLSLVAAAWVVGLIFGLEYGPGTGVALLLASAAGAIAAGLWLTQMPAFPAILAAVLLLAVARVEGSETGNAVAAIVNGRDSVATGVIADDPERTALRVRFELQVREIVMDGGRFETDERWLVYGEASDALVERREPPYFRYGDVVSVNGYPQLPEHIDGFDYPAHLAAQGITAMMFARDVEVAGESGSRWRSALYSVRGRLADSIERTIPYPESALGQALLLGKREALPEGLVERFRGTGASHLLAISGLHVGILLAAVAGTAAWILGRQRPTYLLAAAAAIWLYALVAGAPPSAVRAAVMGSVYLSALAAGRPSSALPALALAAALMTVASPNLIRQVSFQLSFAAVGGIALALAMLGNSMGGLSSPTSGWLKRLTGWAVSLFIVSAAATLATWPLVARTFGEVALLGIPVSLLAIPAMAPAIVAAMAAAVAGLVFEPMGQLLGWIAVAPLGYVVAVVSALPAWTFEADWAGRELLIGYYGCLGLALLTAQPQRTRRFRQALGRGLTRLRELVQGLFSTGTGGVGGRLPLPSPYAALAAAVALAVAAGILWARAAGGPDGLLHVHFLDVGQGDSVLVVTPSGRKLLIDGGPNGDVVSGELSDVLSGGDRSLDLVLMTHLDLDHSGGLLEVLDRFAVGAVLTGPGPADGAMVAEWEQHLERHGIDPTEVAAGFNIDLGDGVKVAVLSPEPERLFGDANNDSVAARLTYGEVAFLLTADLEQEGEELLLGSGETLASTALKVGHHGSKTSSTAEFLEAVGPAVAVISSGAGNRNGHPSPEVVDRLESIVGAGNVFRTDLQGSIEAVSDGASVWVRTER